MGPRALFQLDNYPELLFKRLMSLTIAGDNNCIVWTRTTNQDGYGRVRILDSLESAHRMSFLAYHRMKGDVYNTKVELMHSCNNRQCINPLHLSPGSHLQNMQSTVFPNREGSRNVKAKLTEADVIEIRRRVAAKEFGAFTELAREFGVSATTVKRIAKGILWTHV